MEPERYYMLCDGDAIYFVPEDDWKEYFIVAEEVPTAEINSDEYPNFWRSTMMFYMLDEVRSSISSGKCSLHILGIYYLKKKLEPPRAPIFDANDHSYDDDSDSFSYHHDSSDSDSSS